MTNEIPLTECDDATLAAIAEQIPVDRLVAEIQRRQLIAPVVSGNVPLPLIGETVPMDESGSSSGFEVIPARSPVAHVRVKPVGWKLVPIEPTLDMVMAGETAWERGLDARLDAKPRIEYPSEAAVELAARVAYRAMINAAPSPEISE